MSPQLINRAKKKAAQSICKYRISAMAFDKQGVLLGTSVNKPRWRHPQGGIHSEMQLMRHYGSSIKTIVICRVNKSGDLLPIDPCVMCSEKAHDLRIKIISIKK